MRKLKEPSISLLTEVALGKTAAPAANANAGAAADRAQHGWTATGDPQTARAALERRAQRHPRGLVHRRSVQRSR